MSVTFLGIGNMGAALVTAFLKHNSKNVTVWNRTSARPEVRKVTEAGAIYQPTLEAALASDIIVICVLDYDTIYRILEPIKLSSTALSSKTVINLTNGTPKQAQEMQAWIKARGAGCYFDGAVMVTPQLVGTEHSFLIYSGETEDAYNENVLEKFKSLGLSLYTGQDIKSAATDDLAALSTMYGMFAGAFAGISLIRKQVGEDGKVSPSVNRVVVPLMKALVPYLSLIAETVDKQDWDNNLGNPLGMQVAGVKNILQAYKEDGVSGNALEGFLKVMQKTVDSKGGDVGAPAISLYHDE
ncbi:hypothetical protein QQS21_000745 [Conoideocrella luteorostrata]|uniref:6-phosphogluconate dehydrogenase NADP-binding domain-containing protein n=1 Tax=Conoideocrella luteorostrata TaxID=1105319 RepID=A0AAJ0G2I7_9HYPO|nr:hypothetical protein QQS21_000745 [Conoideocrella luteorostrata]